MSYLGNEPADKFLTIEKQTFTTSATDTYTLDRTVSSPNDIELFLNNVRQEPTTAYTISGTTLTLASAITSSDSMYCIYQGRSVGTVSPATNSVSNDMLVNSSVTVNGTSIDLGASGNISAGITEADQWRLTADLSGDQNPITTNLERVDNADFGYLGTGMTESSGVFSFPSTGIYYVKFNMLIRSSQSTASQFNAIKIFVTTDNSTFTQRAYGSIKSTPTGQDGTSIEIFFDVTDVSTHKVRFQIDFDNTTGIVLAGDTNINETYFTFIRLGDT